MTIQARLETFKSTSRRASPRRKLMLGSTIAGRGADVVIHDMSATGVLLQTSARLEPFDDFEIDLPEIGATSALVVWNSGNYYGCEFASAIPKAAISAALLRNPISSDVPPSISVASTIAPQDNAQRNDLSYGTKLRVILGTSIALWAIILWAIGII